jgi:hypothetical protein
VPVRDPEAAPSLRLPGLAAIGLAVLLVIGRLRLLVHFGVPWTDEDQSLLWYTARELAAGRVHEPYFYGQPYGSWLEALIAAPAVAMGVSPRVALPAAASVLGTAPWLAFAAVAWRAGRRLTTVAILAAAVALALEGSMLATMPRGLVPGIALGSLAAALVLWWPASRAALAGFGLLLVVAASVNLGSGLVTGPVAVHVVLSALPRHWRRLAPLAVGMAAGAVLHALAQAFYRANPGHDVHGTPAFSFDAARMIENLGELDRYLTAYAPELLRHVLAPAALVLAVAGLVVWRGRSLAVAAAAATAVGLSVALLGTAKANDGTASIFFPYSRVYLGLPWMLCALALLPAGGRGRQPASRRTTAAVAAAVASAAAASFLVQQATLTGRVERLVTAAEGVPPVVPVATGDLLQRCELRRQAAVRHEVEIVVERYDRTAAYGCDAVFGDGLTTLFPEYERRTWLLEDAARRRVGRLLVSGFEACPSPAPGASTCAVVDAGERLVLVRGEVRTVTRWVTDLGLPVRPH